MMRLTKISLIIVVVSFFDAQAFSQDEKSNPLKGVVLSGGSGIISYQGDVEVPGESSYVTNFSSNYSIDITKRVGRKMDVNLKYVVGSIQQEVFDQKLSANSFRSDIRNFEFTIRRVFGRGKGVGNNYTFCPYISVGAGYGNFTLFKDTLDQNGNKYNYWSDGTIRDREESYENAFTSSIVQKDRVYETQMDKGNYWYAPLAIGVDMSVGKSLNVDLYLGYAAGFSDNVDGYERTTSDDDFIYGGLKLGVNLGQVYETIFLKEKDNVPPEIFVELLQKDSDGDGVLDINDKCLNNGDNIEVDEHGCPLDQDSDGIPNSIDSDNNSKTAVVDQNGVELKNEELKARRLFFEGKIEELIKKYPQYIDKLIKGE